MEVRLESRSEASAREGAEDLCRSERAWLERLAGDPASFAEVECEVHDRLRGHADRFVAGLLGKRPSPPLLRGRVGCGSR